MIADNMKRGRIFFSKIKIGKKSLQVAPRPVVRTTLTSGFKFPVDDDILGRGLRDENLIVCVMVNKYRIIYKKEEEEEGLVRWGSWEGFPSDTWS
jgi:hypothetical protein